MKKITAKDVVELLAAKHSDDVFVPECKMGATHTQHGDSGRLDAWAMKKSWARPCAFGYEVKISRADFLQDEKWTGYLPYCNEFYFVCPTGLILPDELPLEAGLLYVAKTATRLFTKKKAPRRQVEIPDTIFRYILHSRVKVVQKYQSVESRSNRIELYRQLAKEAKEAKDIGMYIAGLISGRTREIQSENEILKERMGLYAQFRKKLRKAGINPDPDPDNTWDFSRQTDQLIEQIPAGLVRQINETVDGLSVLKNYIDELDAKN